MTVIPAVVEDLGTSLKNLEMRLHSMKSFEERTF